MSVRLTQVERSVVSLRERHALLVNCFRQKVEQFVGLYATAQNARRAAALLEDEGQQAIHDMQCLVSLVSADLKIEQARLSYALEHSPADLERRQQRLAQKVEASQELISSLPSVTKLEQFANTYISNMC